MIKRIKESFTSLSKKKQLIWLTFIEYALIVMLAGATLGFIYLLTQI